MRGTIKTKKSLYTTIYKKNIIDPNNNSTNNIYAKSLRLTNKSPFKKEIKYTKKIAYTQRNSPEERDSTFLYKNETVKINYPFINNRRTCFISKGDDNNLYGSIKTLTKNKTVKDILLNKNDKMRIINDINTNNKLIKRKNELEQQRERERKILEWFYLNDINLSKRKYYEQNAKKLQSAFRVFLINKKNKKHNRKNLFINNNQNNSDLSKDIKELIIQNKELHKKLNEILNDKNSLMKEIENYKQLSNIPNNQDIFTQIEKLYNINNNILEENNKLKNELNKLKPIYNSPLSKQSIPKNYIIEKLNQINFCPLKKKKKYFLKDKQTNFSINHYKNNTILSIENPQKFNIINKNYKNKIFTLFDETKNDFQILRKNSNILNKNNNITIKINDFSIFSQMKKKIKFEIDNQKSFEILNTVINKNLNNNIIKKQEIELLIKNNLGNKYKDLLKKAKLNLLLNNKIYKNNVQLQKIFLKLLYTEKLLELSNKLQPLPTIENIISSPVNNIEDNKNKNINNENIENYTTETKLVPQIELKNQTNDLTITEKNEEPITIEKIVKTETENLTSNINKEVLPSVNEQNNKAKSDAKKSLKKILTKAKNLRKLLKKRLQDNKERLRKYFYMFQYKGMMKKIWSKLLNEKKRELQKKIKQEKKNAALYKEIRSNRNLNEILISIINKNDKKRAMAKRKVLDAWKYKTRILSIQGILVKKHKKKGKKGKKKEKDEEKNEGKEKEENNENENNI